MPKTTPAITAIALLAMLSAHAGTQYKFAVTCPNKELVAQWNIGDIDPGREYLRVATGTNFPGCSISDFNPSRDAGKPIEKYSGAPAVVQGIPLVGQIIGRIFGF